MAFLAPSSNSLMHRMLLALIIQSASILLMMSVPNVVSGAIFACQSGDDTVFQDRPCKQSSPVGAPAKALPDFPLSIHPSWFDLPEHAEERAFCDRRGCECGRVEKKHPGSLAQAVADALFLDGSWHRYESKLQAWMDSPATSAEGYLLREQMLEASCEIMMSQTVLRHFANDMMTILKKRSRVAEERGFDVNAPCLAGVADACTYFEAVELLSRIEKDAQALWRERNEQSQ